MTERTRTFHFKYSDDLFEGMKAWAKEQPDKPWVFATKHGKYPIRINVVTYYDDSAVLLRLLYWEDFLEEIA